MKADSLAIKRQKSIFVKIVNYYAVTIRRMWKILII